MLDIEQKKKEYVKSLELLREQIKDLMSYKGKLKDENSKLEIACHKKRLELLHLVKVANDLRTEVELAKEKFNL